MDCREATLLVAEHYHGPRGLLGYGLFEAVNAHLFASALPWPWVTWALAPHGQCLGLTNSSRQPIITLHPSVLGGTEKRAPWGMQPAWLGVLYALDVMIHECMHVAVNYLRGGCQGGESSHNNPAWIAEVNRIAVLLGFADVQAGMSSPKRAGKTLKRHTMGNIPFKVAATFPHALRAERGEADAYYRAKVFPFPVMVPSGVDLAPCDEPDTGVLATNEDPGQPEERTT
jgi:hypothetical protein